MFVSIDYLFAKPFVTLYFHISLILKLRKLIGVTHS